MPATKSVDALLKYFIGRGSFVSSDMMALGSHDIRLLFNLSLQKEPEAMSGETPIQF
jgi:hypothetical protein